MRCGASPAGQRGCALCAVLLVPHFARVAVACFRPGAPAPATPAAAAAAGAGPATPPPRRTADGHWDATDSAWVSLAKGDPSGMLLAHHPSNGSTTCLLDKLWYGNGVSLSHDESYVLVADSLTFRLVRYWLKGPKAGTSDVWADNLPGHPDGISRAQDGQSYWVTIYCAVSSGAVQEGMRAAAACAAPALHRACSAEGCSAGLLCACAACWVCSAYCAAAHCLLAATASCTCCACCCRQPPSLVAFSGSRLMRLLMAYSPRIIRALKLPLPHVGLVLRYNGDGQVVQVRAAVLPMFADCRSWLCASLRLPRLCLCMLPLLPPVHAAAHRTRAVARRCWATPAARWWRASRLRLRTSRAGCSWAACTRGACLCSTSPPCQRPLDGGDTGRACAVASSPCCCGRLGGGA